VFVSHPLLAVLLIRTLDLGAEVSIAPVALSISLLPPLLPMRGEKAIRESGISSADQTRITPKC
jgi:BASS family bile acid:Na+ symporter